MSKEMPPTVTAHTEDVGVETAVLQSVGADTTAHAKQAARTEHELTAREAIRKYPRAIMWCLVVSMCVVMEGYDLNLLTNFYAYPAFAKRYGTFVESSNNYQLSAPWQAALGNASGIGAFFGTLLNGYLVTKFGHIRVLIGALFTLSAFIFIVFFAPSAGVMVAGQVLCGLPWGIFATTAPAYASEVLPMSLRVYLTSWTNMCFIIGQFIAAGVLAGLVSNDTQWAYRIPFAIQWFWPTILVPILWFAPDTPWHLVRVGRADDAEKSLRRLRPNDTDEEIKEALGLVVFTNNLEQQLSVGTSYWDCFKRDELRRTEIACMCFAGQIFSGLYFAYNSTYFFQQIGLDSEATYRLNVGGNGMALFACILSWFVVMPYVGRRTAYVVGMFVMGTILYIIGALNTRTGDKSFAMTQAVLTLVWTFVFQLSAGQLGWALPAEIGSTRLRQKTICLARNAYAIFGVVAGVLQPYFMNPEEWNISGYVGFFWGTTAFLTCIWAYFRLPETKDRTFDELNLLFAKKVSARHFKSYEIEAFEGSSGEEKTMHKVKTENSQV